MSDFDSLFKAFDSNRSLWEEKAHIPTVNDCSGKMIRRCKWLTFCRSTDYVYDQTDVQRAEDEENTVLLDVQSSRWTDPAVELET